VAFARRSDQAQDRSGQLVGARLHREILDDAVLDLLKPVVIVVQHGLRGLEVLLDLGLLVPRDRQQPVEIVAHDGRFRGHRRHLAQLLQLVLRLLPRFLGELGLGNLLFQIGELVATFVVAELLLDRLHLLVQVILALGLLHLALDARADALLDLQHRDFALHQAQHLLQALRDGQRLQDALAIGDLDGEMLRDLIAQLGEISDRLNHADDFGGDLLVQLHIAFEIGHDRARQRFGFDRVGVGVGERHCGRLVIFAAVGIFLDARTLEPFDQHLHGAVGELQELQHAGERTDLIDRFRARIVIGRVLLRCQQDQRVVLHHFFEGADRLLAANEQRHDHVRKNDDVAKRQYGIGVAFAEYDGWPGFWGRHGLILLFRPLARSPLRLRDRHKVPGVPGRSAACAAASPDDLRRISNVISATESIRWLSGMGVSSHGK
jgi:hypothetical protein